MAKKPKNKAKAAKPVEPVQPSAMIPKGGPVKYVAQVRQEGRKVVWPTRRETVVTTIMVLIFTVLLGAFFFVIDSILSVVVQFIIGLGS